MLGLDLEYEVSTPQSDDYVLCIEANNLYLNEDHTFYRGKEYHSETTFLFKYQGKKYYLGTKPLADYYLTNRSVRTTFKNDTVLMLGVAFQLARFYKQNTYCGVCGQKMVKGIKERNMNCVCGYVNYPKISPAAIVAIIDRTNDCILLTKIKGTSNSYGLVAGFVEVGESYEECIMREVKEEVGLEITNLKWFANDPWSFGDNLMGAFVADLKGDNKITLQESELDGAIWMPRAKLEVEEEPISIGGKLKLAFKKGEI